MKRGSLFFLLVLTGLFAQLPPDASNAPRREESPVRLPNGKLQSEEVHRIFEINQNRFESKWNTAWRGHKTRPGVRPVSAANRIPISEFFKDDGEP